MIFAYHQHFHPKLKSWNASNPEPPQPICKERDGPRVSLISANLPLVLKLDWDVWIAFLLQKIAHQMGVAEITGIIQ